MNKKFLLIILFLSLVLVFSLFINIKLKNEINKCEIIIENYEETIIYQEKTIRKINMDKYNEFLRKQEIENTEEELKND